MRVLVLGGNGFIGRHASLALAKRGHSVIIGSRRPGRLRAGLPASLSRCERREAHLERLLSPEAWRPLLKDVDVVVNAVGILRERGSETYDRVHHLAPGALAASCAHHAIRLVHVSALGLRADSCSRFLSSKLAGERAVAACGSNYSVVRPALLDGDGGFGAKWLRRVARWPVHPVPSDAVGKIDALDVADLGEAIAVLCELAGAPWRETELGGGAPRTLGDYLAALRPAELGAAPRVTVPGWLVRVASHLFDLVHFSPLSFGHVELLRRDNKPTVNAISTLLGREPRPVGSRGRATLGPSPGFRGVAGPS